MARLTWQEVSAPDFGSSISGLKNAFDSLDRGFERAGQTIDQYDAAQTAAQSNAIMAKMLQFGSPEAAQAALVSGELTAGVDPRRINAAAFQSMEGRPGELQKLEADRLGLIADGNRLESETMKLGRERVSNADYMYANSEEIRPVINEFGQISQMTDPTARATAMTEFQTKHSEVLKRLPIDAIRSLITGGQGIATAEFNYGNTFGDDQRSDVDRELGYALDNEYTSNYQSDQGEVGVNSNRQAIIDKYTPKYGAQGANRIFNGLLSRVRGESQQGSGMPGGGGGAPSGGGGGSGTGTGNSERIVNYEAKGRTGVSVVPDSVQTLGDLVEWGKNINTIGDPVKSPKKDRSSATGLYQITYSTYDEFGKSALGDNWKSAPLNAENQDKVGEKIFQNAVGKGNPVEALRGRWAALKKLPEAEVQAMVKGGWASARNRIAQLESGGQISQTGQQGYTRPPAPVADPLRSVSFNNMANAVAMSEDEFRPIVQDFLEVRDSRLNLTQVAKQLTGKGGTFEGETSDAVVPFLRKIQKDYGVGNVAMAGKILANSRDGRKGYFRSLGNVFAEAGGIMGSVDWDRAKNLAKAATDREFMGNMADVSAVRERAMGASQAGMQLVTQLRAAQKADVARAASRGLPTEPARLRWEKQIGEAEAVLGAAVGVSGRTAMLGQGPRETGTAGSNKTRTAPPPVVARAVDQAMFRSAPPLLQRQAPARALTPAEQFLAAQRQTMLNR